MTRTQRGIDNETKNIHHQPALAMVLHVSAWIEKIELCNQRDKRDNLW